MVLLMTLLAVFAVKTPIPGVVTPTGNIHCLYVPGPPAHLLCDIHHAAYNQREQDGCMARAGLDWHGWELAKARKGQPVCSGGILYNSNENVPRYRKLAYGKTWTYRGFTCTSRFTGLTCRAGVHGLFISRASWRGW
jgi:hypothetical protein